MSSNNLSLLYEMANKELDKLADWFKANKLTLNISKTKYILFRDKKVNIGFENLELAIENEKIERIGNGCKEESFKFVGVHLDEFLDWNFHAKFVSKKVQGAVFALSKIRNLLPSHIKYTVYNSLFRSFIEYGISAWGKTVNTEIKRICILQKRAVRFIDNAKYVSNVMSTHWGLTGIDCMMHCICDE